MAAEHIKVRIVKEPQQNKYTQTNYIDLLTRPVIDSERKFMSVKLAESINNL